MKPKVKVLLEIVFWVHLNEAIKNTLSYQPTASNKAEKMNFVFKRTLSPLLNSVVLLQVADLDTLAVVCSLGTKYSPITFRWSLDPP